LKRDADGSFVEGALMLELFERAVICFDGSQQRFAWFHATGFRLIARVAL
jgi:hypothetical protein